MNGYIVFEVLFHPLILICPPAHPRPPAYSLQEPNPPSHLVFCSTLDLKSLKLSKSILSSKSNLYIKWRRIYIGMANTSTPMLLKKHQKHQKHHHHHHHHHRHHKKTKVFINLNINMHTTLFFHGFPNKKNTTYAWSILPKAFPPVGGSLAAEHLQIWIDLMTRERLMLNNK